MCAHYLYPARFFQSASVPRRLPSPPRPNRLTNLTGTSFFFVIVDGGRGGAFAMQCVRVACGY